MNVTARGPSYNNFKPLCCFIAPNSRLNHIGGPVLKIKQFEGPFLVGGGCKHCAISRCKGLWGERIKGVLVFRTVVHRRCSLQLYFLDGGLCFVFACKPSSHRTEMWLGWARVCVCARGGGHPTHRAVTPCSNGLI